MYIKTTVKNLYANVGIMWRRVGGFCWDSKGLAMNGGCLWFVCQFKSKEKSLKSRDAGLAFVISG
jgi:hypothetical protein